jgi:outer membrane biosynthesis protein TonB
MRFVPRVLVGLVFATVAATAAFASPVAHLGASATHHPATAQPCESPSPDSRESPTPEPSDSISPEPRESPSPEPSDTASPEPSETPEPCETPSPEPTETHSPDPSESPSPSSDATPVTCPSIPPPSGPVTGLKNAIEHVSANCQRHPNRGLVNALNHLQANEAAQQLRRAQRNEDAREGVRGKDKIHPQGKARGHSGH